MRYFQIHLNSQIKITSNAYSEALKAKSMQLRVNWVVRGYWTDEEMSEITLALGHAKKYNKKLITDENWNDIKCKCNFITNFLCG